MRRQYPAGMLQIYSLYVDLFDFCGLSKSALLLLPLTFYGNPVFQVFSVQFRFRQDFISPTLTSESPSPSQTPNLKLAVPKSNQHYIQLSVDVWSD